MVASAASACKLRVATVVAAWISHVLHAALFVGLNISLWTLLISPALLAGTEYRGLTLEAPSAPVSTLFLRHDASAAAARTLLPQLAQNWLLD